ncbi:hypothetical protein SFR_3354 [Streptomyces sp. FR-008]|nr:hypothetical protein SFR_3354 [Streptomyces sp. FR-008]
MLGDLLDGELLAGVEPSGEDLVTERTGDLLAQRGAGDGVGAVLARRAHLPVLPVRHRV